MLNQYQHLLAGQISGKDAKLILDGLGEAGSYYRTTIYNSAFSGNKQSISLEKVKDFLRISIQYMDHSIRANKRQDNLYHAYNLVTIEEGSDELSISYLSEMLEGQVAVLSSGYLSSTEVLELLEGLKSSPTFPQRSIQLHSLSEQELARI